MLRKNEKKKKRYAVNSHFRLMLRIMAVYYVVLLLLIFLVSRSGAAFYEGEYYRRPTVWLWILWTGYYALPAVLALVYGLVFRPFWKHFRNLFLAILACHGLYSVGVHLWREDYLQDQRDLRHQCRLADLVVYKTDHALSDDNADGVIDRVEVLISFDAEFFPDGPYTVEARLTQKGQSFPNSRIGRFRFDLAPGKDRYFNVRFQFDPEIFEPYYGSGDFSLDLAIQRRYRVNEPGQKIKSFSRWSPFLKGTNWDGNDQRIADDVWALDVARDVERFEIMPLQLPGQQVVALGYAGDYGRDTDGDGLFDEVVVEVLVKSRYEGPVFIHALLHNSGELIVSPSRIELGQGRMEIVIPARYLRGFHSDGPFDLRDVYFYNKNPHCQEGECPKRIKPDFEVYLDNYQTEAYSSDRFSVQ